MANAAVVSTMNVATTATQAITSAKPLVAIPPGVRYGRSISGSRMRSTMWLTIMST
ncbi:Uncharacterised protein [Mycobacteroides abscessus subsp. abscessus]|nr:Uncharacterised protein [Mycobacteroides abscessus subsp. abscessus]